MLGLVRQSQTPTYQTKPTQPQPHTSSIGESLSTCWLRPPSGQQMTVEVAAAAIQGPPTTAAPAEMAVGVQGLRCDPAALVPEDRWSLRPGPTDAHSCPPGGDEPGSHH